MAKADLGKKRVCLACGMRFYDFSRSPIICPGCGAEFDPENIIKSRKGRAVTKAVTRNDADSSGVDPTEVDGNAHEIISSADDVSEDDDIDFDENDDVDVDVDDDDAGVIQDDISDDAELLPSLDDKDDS